MGEMGDEILSPGFPAAQYPHFPRQSPVETPSHRTRQWPNGKAFHSPTLPSPRGEHGGLATVKSGGKSCVRNLGPEQNFCGTSPTPPNPRPPVFYSLSPIGDLDTRRTAPRPPSLPNTLRRRKTWTSCNAVPRNPTTHTHTHLCRNQTIRPLLLSTSSADRMAPRTPRQASEQSKQHKAHTHTHTHNTQRHHRTLQPSKRAVNNCPHPKAWESAARTHLQSPPAASTTDETQLTIGEWCSGPCPHGNDGAPSCGPVQAVAALLQLSR